MAGQKAQNVQTGKRASARMPITEHPLFPALIALWFAALFGLGSLAVRPGLFEALILSFQLDVLVPAAAPPLGMTARILISLTMAIAGGCLGGFVARIISRPRTAIQPRKRNAFGRAEADSSHQFQTGPASRAGAITGNRRRSLTSEEDDTGPEYQRETASRPGGTPKILDVTEFDFGQPAQPLAAAAPLPEMDLPADKVSTVELNELPAASQSKDDGPHQHGPICAEPDAKPVQANMAADPGVSGGSDTRPMQIQARMRFENGTWRAENTPLTVFAEVQTLAPGALAPGALATVSIGSEPERDVKTASDSAEEAPTQRFVLPAASAAERIASAELNVLSHVELIERLAISLQSRRAFDAAAAQARAELDTRVEMSAPAPVPDWPVTLTLPEVAGSSDSAPLPRMPAALRALNFDDFAEDDDGDADEASAFAYIPARSIAMPPAAAAAPQSLVPETAQAFHGAADHESDEAEETEDASGDSAENDSAQYSSLLAVGRPPAAKMQQVKSSLMPGRELPERPDHDRALAQPAVVFPGLMPQRDIRPAEPGRFAAPAAVSANPTGGAGASSTGTGGTGTGGTGTSSTGGGSRLSALAPATPTPTQPAAALAAPGEGAALPRRFDAPASTHAPGKPASSVQLPHQNHEETETALRVALTTLQRMSGAA